jgi:hypothetical protein
MDSAEQMTELAVSVGEKESLSVASRCLGIYAMGTENWSAAIQYLQDAVAIMRELGRLDSETETQLLLSLSLHRQDGQSGALEDIARIEDIVNSGKIPKLSPLVALAKSEIERGRQSRSGGGLSGIDSLGVWGIHSSAEKSSQEEIAKRRRENCKFSRRRFA